MSHDPRRKKYEGNLPAKGGWRWGGRHDLVEENEKKRKLMKNERPQRGQL
jgi:hypothetical protein